MVFPLPLREGVNMINSPDIAINELGTRMVRSLEEEGWAVETETDYPDDYKEYNVAKSQRVDDIFPRFTVLLLTLHNDPNNLDVRFIFYAKPAMIKPNKRAFARVLRTQHIKKLQEQAEALLRQCNVITQQEEVTIDSRPKYKLKFDSGPAVSPAYAIQLHYWKYPSSNEVFVKL